jgi:hypothetical protein
MAENIAALRRGDLDVVQVFEPFVSMALQERIGEVLHAATRPSSRRATGWRATGAASPR